MRTRILWLVLGCSGVVATVATAQSQVIVNVETSSKGAAIPTDFSGLGFERGTESSGNAHVSGYLFSPQNKQLVMLFQTLGIKNLRIGGGSVDDESIPGAGSDGFTGVDNLFQFAQVAGVHVIYSLRLLNPASSPIPNLQVTDAAVAQHIAQNFAAELASFAIGNEPDFHSYHTYCTKAGCTCNYPTGCTGTSSNLHVNDRAIYETVQVGSSLTAGTAFPSYLADWKNFANTITAGIPATAAKLSAPDTGAYSTLTDYNGASWTQLMADNLGSTGTLANVTQHVYVGGSPGTTTAQQAIDNMLSTQWLTGNAIATGPEGSSTYTPYPWLYTNNLEPAVADGVPYRLTESDDYLTGINGASNVFASALWALDYMHWWADHNAAGVNFHNKQWIYTDTIVPSPNPCVGTCGDYQTTPKGYGIKAFDLGGHGYVKNVTLMNPNRTNITAYASGGGQDLSLTLINKTHATTNDATTANVSVALQGLSAASVASMTLTDGSPGDPSLATATLGGATIANNQRWLGMWTPMKPTQDGQLSVTLPASTAMVLKIRAASAYQGPIQINQSGALQLFAVDNAGNVWTNSQQTADLPASSPQNWTGWNRMLPGIAAAGTPAVVRNLDNTLQIFVPTAGGDVFYNRQLTPDGTWGGWTDMGASSKGMTHLYAAANADSSLSVFGIGQNGDLWYASESAPEVGWSNWTDMTGQPIEPGYVIGQDLNGLLEVFGLDSQFGIWHNAQSDPVSWTGWSQLNPTQVHGSDTRSAKFGGNSGHQEGRLAVARDLDGRLELFVLGSDHHLLQNAQQSPGGPWGSWTRLDGPAVQPGFVVGQDATGRLTVFGGGGSPAAAIMDTVATHDNEGENNLSDGIWSATQQTPGGPYGHWNYLGGIGTLARLVVSNTADGRVQLFAINADHNVVSTWQTSPGDEAVWSEWKNFEGNGLALYYGQP